MSVYISIKGKWLWMKNFNPTKLGRYLMGVW